MRGRAGGAARAAAADFHRLPADTPERDNRLGRRRTGHRHRAALSAALRPALPLT
ncbi:hypothetical protein ACPA9J_33690 [Pseudomonas aeruginosa]